MTMFTISSLNGIHSVSAISCMNPIFKFILHLNISYFTITYHRITQCCCVNCLHLFQSCF